MWGSVETLPGDGEDQARALRSPRCWVTILKPWDALTCQNPECWLPPGLSASAGARENVHSRVFVCLFGRIQHLLKNVGTTV